ncbi:hypothetical protein ACSFS4_003267 [Escherichia coli]
MKRLIPILASAASMTIPVAAMADNIVCHGGWSKWIHELHERCWRHKVIA